MKDLDVQFSQAESPHTRWWSSGGWLLPRILIRNSVLQTLRSAVKMYTTSRQGRYLCCEEIRKGSMQMRDAVTFFLPWHPNIPSSYRCGPCCHFLPVFELLCFSLEKCHHRGYATRFGGTINLQLLLTRSCWVCVLQPLFNWPGFLGKKQI